MSFEMKMLSLILKRYFRNTKINVSPNWAVSQILINIPLYPLPRADFRSHCLPAILRGNAVLSAGTPPVQHAPRKAERLKAWVDGLVGNKPQRLASEMPATSRFQLAPLQTEQVGRKCAGQLLEVVSTPEILAV